MKTWSIILAAAIILFLTSAITHPDRLEQGGSAPEFVFTSKTDTLSSANLKGKYVLLNVWNPEEASSRIANKQYDNAFSKINNDSIEYVAVATGDQTLVPSIVKVDNLDPENQFIIGEERIGSLKRAMKPDNLNYSYLIGPNGKIVAVNPTPTQITQRFGRRRIAPVEG